MLKNNVTELFPVNIKKNYSSNNFWPVINLIDKLLIILFITLVKA